MNIEHYEKIATIVSACASVLSLFITGAAAFVAYRALKSWKEHEKYLQILRLKRAIFSYQQKVQKLPVDSRDNSLINEYMVNVLIPASDIIYYEMMLCGVKDDGGEDISYFNKLFDAQLKYKDSQLNYKELVDSIKELKKYVEQWN
ncbi:hypothetical protein D5952_19330 [Salmonella enterica subsp. enterica]|nr:hypothetical protein [Salmonella enterica subsp. enterica serovar Bonn]MLZ42049.1 hypothetical protein [Salmonella enterica subsp. enterica serovar Bonn]